MKKEQSLPYDKYDVKSIVEYAQKLVGSTLREHINVDSIADPHRRKGSFGNALEEDYFLLAINSDPRPDFHEVDLELKSTPLKRVRGNELARRVKLADIADNADPVRLAGLDSATRERLQRKYQHALEAVSV